MTDELARVMPTGAAFNIEPPHTVESLRADAERSKQPASWRCRHGRHRYRVVGAVHVSDNWVQATLDLLASSDVDSLSRCDRCGKVAVMTR